MSDSSEDEDLSKFREAVDDSFLNKLNKVNTVQPIKSERYLEEASHYNDVKYPADLQNKIAKKISKLIESKVEFVSIEEPKKIKKRKIKGGVKLFKDSEDYLTCEDAVDTYTEGHNKNAVKSVKKKIIEDTDITEDEKIKLVAVDPEDVLSKKGTEHWKSRRKDKLFKYKKTKSNVLLAVE